MGHDWNQNKRFNNLESYFKISDLKYWLFKWILFEVKIQIVLKIILF